MPDKFELRPDIDWNSRLISDSDINKIYQMAVTAVTGSIEYAARFSERSAIGLPRISDDEFLSLYLDAFQEKLFYLVRIGNKDAAREACERIRREVRVACFRNEAPNLWHWREYGDGGTGICYEISERYAFDLPSLYITQNVLYTDDHSIEIFDIALLMIFLRIHRDWTLGNLSFWSRDHSFFKSANKFFLTKRKIFEQEKEVRLVDFSSNIGGYIKAPGLFLSRIIFGPNCEDTFIDDVMAFSHALAPDIAFARAKDNGTPEGELVNLCP